MAAIKNVCLIVILYSLYFFISLQKAYADKVPNFVYIMGTKAPQFSFDNGITAPGTDYNLLDTLTGASVTSDTSGYIPANRSSNKMLDIIRYFLKNRTPDEPDYYWLYSILPARNFYDANHSVHVSAQMAQSQNPELFTRLQEIEGFLRGSNLHIFVARNRVLPTQIQSATLYRLVNDTIIAMTTMQNPNYINTTPVINTDDILITGSSDQYIFYSEMGTYHILPGAFCQPFFSKTTPIKSSLENVSCTKHTYQELKMKLSRIFVTIFGMPLDN